MKKMTETDIAMNINNLTYIDYLNRLKLIATSLFTWKGLDEIAGFGASRFLELVLYENGRACFVKDKEKGYLALRVNPSDKLNVYMLPEKVLAWSLGYNKNYLFDDVIYINGRPTVRNYYISVSHKNKYVVAAISKHEISVDIELIKDFNENINRKHIKQYTFW